MDNASTPDVGEIANGSGSLLATLVEIDIGTCPAMAGRPSGRKSLRRRDIQRRDALLQVPNYFRDHRHSLSKGTLVGATGPDPLARLGLKRAVGISGIEL